MKPIHRTDPSIPDRRGRRAATAALATAVLLPAGLLAALPGSPAHAEPNCPPEEFPCIEDPVPDPDEMPPALGIVQITSRTTTSTAPGAASFAFRLLIPARATSWSLQRQLSSGWTSVRSGSSTGTPHYLTTSHTGLTPDQRYCYRLVATNTNGSSTTTPLCAYTRDGRDIDVSRIWLMLVETTSE